jgi:hypothetical protein
MKVIGKDRGNSSPMPFVWLTLAYSASHRGTLQERGGNRSVTAGRQYAPSLAPERLRD